MSLYLFSYLEKKRNIKQNKERRPVILAYIFIIFLSISHIIQSVILMLLGYFHGLSTIFIISSFLSNPSYPFGASSSFIVWVITLVGSMRPVSTRWSNCSLYFFTGHCPM